MNVNFMPLKLSQVLLTAFTLFTFSAYAQTDQSSTSPETVKQDTKQDNTQSNTPSLISETDKISYAIGADIGRNFKNLDVPLNPQLLAQGVKDSLENSKTLLMDQKDIQATLVSFQKELIAKRQTVIQKISDKNKSDGEKFLNENKKKPGVITLPDGLQYKVVKDGKGESPKDTDTVIVNYEGSFINGQIFDSSYAKGKPVTFPVNGVISGWTEVLKLMKPGAQWMVYIPSALAYGDRGVGPIEPNQVLIFKIELIAIQPPVTSSTTTGAHEQPKK